MKKHNIIVRLFAALLLLTLVLPALAQDNPIQYWRPWDQRGVNVFEPKKQDITGFEGLKVRVGGSFTQQYQSLTHENDANVILRDNTLTAAKGDSINLNALYPLAGGFNLATANLNLDIQLEDGIRITLENYMSARHHQEFWVKGGYIQVDKLPMFGNPEWFTKYARVKIGHFQVNYGDQQFRRTDNGNAMYNPFVGEYIMDAFATEIGGELYLFPTSDLMLMGGITNGLIKGEVKDIERKPSFYGKLAFDKQLNEDFRVRLSGSLYTNEASGRNTLYAGDRAGSRFYFALEPEYFLSNGVLTAATTDTRYTSGRVSPGFSTKVTAMQVSPFIKFKGIELFATYEQSQGYAANDPKAEGTTQPEERKVTQIAVEGIFRFLPREQAYIGARYNTLNGEIDARLRDAQNNPLDLTVNRYELAAGWYATKNLLLKGAYINQEYKDFPKADLRAGGLFKGFTVEAVVGF